MQKKIAIIGVPQDLGASRRGVDMGPSAMRLAGLESRLKSLGHEVIDWGNITCHDIDEHTEGYQMDERLRFLPFIADMAQHLKEAVERAVGMGYFPLVLGGDHSISIGTMAGMKKLHGGRTGIIWVDAHGDFNTPETTPSGNIHGMPFAVTAGFGVKELTQIGPSPTISLENAVLFGARDLDPGEIGNLKKAGVKVISMSDIDRDGILRASTEAISHATKGVDHLHVSFDIDSVDPFEAPGTGTPVSGGLTYREAHFFLEMVADTNKLSSFEMVEVNPILDTRNKTANLAVGLILSAMGKKIW
ncbi:MAG: arginase [Methanobacteriota archaeon]|nr:MAG: arginase [Euryarchaeota archaeon]